MTDAAPRFSRRIKPFTALVALARVLRDKEATHEVFRLTAALDGPIAEKNFRRFEASPVGARVLAEKTDLAYLLADRDQLAALPSGSVGRAYLDFVTREGLSVEGFQQEMDSTGENMERIGEDRARFIYRARHSHDLYHVLTGYGRDFVGELSLLAFTRRINNSLGLGALVIGGLFKGWREYPGLPVWACVREGARLGAAAEDLLCADWEALLELPLGAARARLKVGAPKRYLAIQAGAEAVDRRLREALAA